MDRPRRKNGTAPEASLRAHALVALLLTAVVAVAYAPVVNLSFLSDDWAVIRLATLRGAEAYWAEILKDFYTPLFEGIPKYRPLYSLSFGLDYTLYGADPLGYHVTNLVLHAASSFFVYLLALEMMKMTAGGRGREIAVTTGVLFALYPVHPEAVTWIAGRVDLICAVFYLPAVLFFLRWLRVGSRFYLVVSLLSFALALLAKEMAITLPGLLLLLALYWSRSFVAALKSVLPFAAVLVAYLLFRTYVLSGIESTGVLGRELDFLRMTQGFLYRTLHMFVPLNFGLLPAGWVNFTKPLFFLWPIPVMVALIFAYVRGWTRSVFALLLFALYAVAMIPVAPALGPDPTLVSSRWSYIPSAFLALLLAYVAWTIFGNRTRLAATVSVAVCVAFFAVLLVNHGPWLRAGEITERLLERGEEPEMPLKYKGAHVFGNRITWISANEPPFGDP